MVILHTHTQIQKVFNLVPGQKQFSFFSSFFSSLSYYYHYFNSSHSIRYCMYISSEQSDCSRIIDDDGQWRKREREKNARPHVLHNHAYYTKKKAQRTRMFDALIFRLIHHQWSVKKRTDILSGERVLIWDN